MPDLFYLTEAQLLNMKPYFPKSHGVPRVDDLRVISGIIHVLKIGLQWRDAPREYSPHKTLYNRFIRWSEMGVFNKIFKSLKYSNLSLRLRAFQNNYKLMQHI